MSDLICCKTMQRCQTPGMCSPHGGCSDSSAVNPRAPLPGAILAADHDRIVAELTDAGTKLQAERDQLAERCRELEECLGGEQRARHQAELDGIALRAEVEELRKSQGAEMFLTLTGEITNLRAEVEALRILLKEWLDADEHKDWGEYERRVEKALEASRCS